MQSLRFFFLFLTFSLAIVNGQQTKNQDILSISSGLSFGKCIGHCQQSINATSNPPQVIVSRLANFAQASYPPVHVKFPFTTTEWNDLVALADLESFQLLDERIGCPGCADDGVEWIQIDWINGNKRVAFERRQMLKGSENLVQKLREMRQFYLNKV